MTHDELMLKIDAEIEYNLNQGGVETGLGNALCAVVELHKNYRLDGIYYECSSCGKSTTYCPTIQAIEKELT